MGLNKNYAYLLLLLSACSSIEGIYKWTGNKVSPNHYELVINNNGMFQYRGWSDVLGSDTICGYWKYKSDTLYLEKFEKDTSDWITVKQLSVDSLQNEILVGIMDEEGRHLLGADIFVNGNNIVVEDYIRLDRVPNKIRINYLSMNFSFNLSNSGNSNVFNIYINFKNINLNYFHVTPKWIKNGNKLIQVDKNAFLVENGIFKK